MVRSSSDGDRLAPVLCQDIQSIDSGITLAQVGTMEQALASSVSQPRFNTMVLALFAGTLDRTAVFHLRYCRRHKSLVLPRVGFQRMWGLVRRGQIQSVR